jgi:GTP-binding nuclear protein Ran
MNKSIKVLFIGDAKSGKTRACSKLMGSSKGALTPYAPTIGVEVHKYTTQNGTIIDIWDCAGDKRFSGLRDNYFIDADICIIFGYNQAEWVREVQSISEKVITYVFHNVVSLRHMFESISGGSPKGYVTDEDITIINVLSQ